MTADYHPKDIARLRQILDQAPGLDILWFTGLEHAPWFEDSADGDVLARLDKPASDSQGWIQNHLQEFQIEGDFLLHLNDGGRIPWARVKLSSGYEWLPALLSHSHDLAFVSPNYTLRLDIRVTDDGVQIVLQRRSPFDLDQDED